VNVNSDEVHIYTVSDLCGGLIFSAPGPTEVIHCKEIFKKACQELVPVLDLYGQRDSYEYEEEIDYPTNVQL
jgi:hypothetical protein